MSDIRSILSKLEDLTDRPEAGDILQLECGDTLIECEIQKVLPDDSMLVFLDETAIKLIGEARQRYLIENSLSMNNKKISEGVFRPEDTPSDWDYAETHKRKKRSEPYGDEDEDPYADIEARREREYQQTRAKTQKRIDNIDGEAPNGRRYNSILTIQAPSKNEFEMELRKYEADSRSTEPRDLSYSEVTDTDDGIEGKIYFINYHRYGSFKPFKDEPAVNKKLYGKPPEDNSSDLAEGYNSSRFDQRADLEKRSNDELNAIIRKFEHHMKEYPEHTQFKEYLELAKEIRAGRIGKKTVREQGVAEGTLTEAEYQGRKVTLNKPMAGDVKKFRVYVKNKKGNVVKVNFGQKGVKIKKSNPERRKSFRARHKCDTAKDKTTARYWSCRKW